MQHLAFSSTSTSQRSSNVARIPAPKAAPKPVGAVAPAAAAAAAPAPPADFSPITVERTGQYIRKWPDVFRAPTHFKRALRSLKHVKVDKTMKNIRNQQRKFAATSLDTLMKALTVPLTQLLQCYQYGFRSLHPFEQTVANLTITALTKRQHPALPEILERLQRLRAETCRVAKDHAKRANTAATANEAKDILNAGITALRRLYVDEDVDPEQDGVAASSTDVPLLHNPMIDEARALSDLLVVHQDLKRVPVLELRRPTVVLVGAPNVGKSSLVRAMSSGTPEVNDYPFTTRGVTIGHIYATDEDDDDDDEDAASDSADDGEGEGESDREGDREEAKRRALLAKETVRDVYVPEGKKLPSQKVAGGLRHASARYQVMDTPGLLNRPDDKRNEMERLTFASLAQLPTAVIFVVDPTELAGKRLSSLVDQLHVRRQLRTRFPKRPWIDVLSKSDVALTEAQQQLLREAGLLPSSDGSSSETAALRVSVRTGDNLDTLRRAVRQQLLVLEDILHNSNFQPAAGGASSSS